MRISDWSSDVCSSDLQAPEAPEALAAGAAEEAGDDGAIVVTARRREERLSDVPTAASVIDIAALNDRGGATGSGELLADQPSVRFNKLNSSNTYEISIREIGRATCRERGGPYE